MKKFVWLGLALGVLVYLAFVTKLAAAAEPDRGPRRIDQHADQYTQSCVMGRPHCLRLSTVGDAEQFREMGQYGPTYRRQVFRWGEQLRVTVNPTGQVALFMHMTTTPTISLGPSNGHGEGLGWSESDQANTYTGVLPGDVFNATSTDFLKISQEGWIPYLDAVRTSTINTYPTARPGSCSTAVAPAGRGGGCRTHAECGTTGYCRWSGISGVTVPTRPPQGVYISAIPLTANAEVCLTVCAQ